MLVVPVRNIKYFLYFLDLSILIATNIEASTPQTEKVVANKELNFESKKGLVK